MTASSCEISPPKGSHLSKTVPLAGNKVFQHMNSVRHFSHLQVILVLIASSLPISSLTKWVYEFMNSGMVGGLNEWMHRKPVKVCLFLVLSIIALSGIALSNEFFYQRGGTYSPENMHCECSRIWKGGRVKYASKVGFWSMARMKQGRNWARPQ